MCGDENGKLGGPRASGNAARGAPRSPSLIVMKSFKLSEVNELDKRHLLSGEASSAGTVIEGRQMRARDRSTGTVGTVALN